MLWRLLWSFRVRSLGGGAAGFPRPRPVTPVESHEGEPLFLDQEPAQPGRRHGRHQQHRSFRCGNFLHRYISLDAFTWSALAVLALELAKQVQWLSSAKLGGGGTSQLAILPPHQLSAPPACSSGKKEPHFFVGGNSDPALENPSSSQTSQPEENKLLSEREDFFQQSVLLPTDLDSHLLCLQGNLEQEDYLNEAASQVQQVFQASVSMAFNILGLEFMQDGQCKMAFSCFKLAADQNYSKAQFNVGSCYEHGRGTKKDVAKAVLYYQRAAQQGHTMAQYHYAKWLLCRWPKADNDSSVQEAVDLLDQAATAGLTQDSSSRFLLGVCYEKGFGVPQNQLSARKYYQKAAAEGYKLAQERMKIMAQEEITAMQSQHPISLATRTFFSSPCLQSLDQPLASHSLLHSWSTGNLKDVTNSCVNCMLQPLTLSSGIAIG
ncbi:death ligand signal enhancer isoform X2 [Hemicordylus capensis]|uniref:death ligand signal enhancer isoform X2 n=1 Tax=Hemicordylus capensis TaxID=884348 RepID=UPI002303561B|nr:death ligand signal enhancer isoform X2 [Hemicordylus capensis]